MRERTKSTRLIGSYFFLHERNEDPHGGEKKKNVELRAILGENSLYRHKEGSFRKISKGLRVGCKEERFEKKGTKFKIPAGPCNKESEYPETP